MGSLLDDPAHFTSGISLEGGSTVPSVARFSVVNTQVSNSIDSIASFISKGHVGGGFVVDFGERRNFFHVGEKTTSGALNSGGNHITVGLAGVQIHSTDGSNVFNMQRGLLKTTNARVTSSKLLTPTFTDVGAATFASKPNFNAGEYSKVSKG